ncbi:activator-dependent family glycosyltransferase [Streptomyces bugieae]|uniref:Activator-dependent family glycosyltransferase n=1 Tax=Streptomyces bugieae TaxID=3098223 RepID=A0ABU7P0I0_9ACTN|nr:activator-dependent family glycosyltransferase [Streptomyces sp. DSM 41528]
MRVLFLTLPAKAHLYPQVPLAWALRAAGHEVCVAGNPDLTAEIARTGLTAVPVGAALDQAGMVEQNQEREREQSALSGDGPDPEELLKWTELEPGALDHTALQGLFTVATTLVFRTYSPDRTLDELVAFAREWRPDLVIWDTLVLAGPVVAKAVGAAHARLLYGLDLIGHMREQYLHGLDARPLPLREDPVEEWLGPVLDRYDTAFSEDVVTGQWTIDPVPTSMRLPVDLPYLPMRHIPYNGRAVIPHWLTEPPERPRVCLTLGLSLREVLGGDRASVRTLLDAVADLDLEVVATLDAEQLSGVSRLPDNVRAFDFVPLNELLPSCSAIVHQGGFGQVQTALAHGVPQLSLPNGQWDTVPRAQQIQDSGVGLRAADVDHCKAGDLRQMLVRLVEEPAFARTAAAVRGEMLATPAPHDIVPVLERLTAEHRLPAGPA